MSTNRRHISTTKPRPVVLVTCHVCGTEFDRGYRICAKRAARPQVCSKTCGADLQSRVSSKDTVDAFWSKVNKGSPDECWEWTGHRRPLGYGWFNLNRKSTTASRVAYLLSNGPIPRGKVVCHSCDNPPCCNPAHLWLGTQRDNVRDMIAKGRKRHDMAPRGANHPKARLTPEQAIEAFSSTESDSAIARKFGVTPQAIYNIRKGLSWAHTTGARNG